VISSSADDVDACPQADPQQDQPGNAGSAAESSAAVASNASSAEVTGLSGPTRDLERNASLAEVEKTAGRTSAGVDAEGSTELVF
jgi:hypothetical protein